METKTKIKPLGNRVLVKKIEEQEQIKGGIIIPDAAKEASQEAEVIALGSGRNDEGKVLEFEVKVGDRVLVSKYGGTEVKRDKETLVVLRQDDILAVLG
ncbi:MAG: co-chaperone GroES [Puniceicoccales bacterium]|jgi:chaperonin GroES|nr:co-chaperone GroES [Puniceicoccales bacterium]MDR2603388.1 co-chaperone GroES [Puniceicoccales bacterium]